jgi:hypothetical protein
MGAKIASHVALLARAYRQERKTPLTIVAHYCAVGAESFMNTAQGQISYETLAEILQAFLAAYAIARRPKKSMRDFLYLRTLPADKQVDAKEVKTLEAMTCAGW